jgi:class 3 adenylate cyclase/tetratricopeptide (TPR) repeat protein
VTVLFADLKGSMELLAERDPEEARQLLDPVLARMMEAVHRYEGTVNQVLGDGIMALFGAPIALEDHAVRACYAALSMQAAVQQYAEEVRHSHGLAVQIRVGLNSGEVVVRAIGNDLHMDYSAIGQTTHLAARMEQLATPGSTLMTAETLQLVEGLVRVTSLGPVPVRGLSAPVEVFELVRAGSTRRRLQAAAARGLTRFVGRQTEVEALQHALARAEAGHGQVAAIVGEAGVGKSRLVYECVHWRDCVGRTCVLTHARAGSPFPATAPAEGAQLNVPPPHSLQGWLVLESASVSYGKATPYFSVIDLLKRYVQVEEGDDLRTIRARVTGQILTLDEGLQEAVPALLALLDAVPEDSPFLQLEPSQRRQRMLDALKRVLLRESQAQPLLLVFEDLHWIDAETQALLDTLVESLPTARLLLLVNYRPEYQHGWGSKTYYTQLRLDPLPPASAEDLLQALLGDDPNLAPLTRLLIARTEGNPFFLEESVRALVEIGVLVGKPGAYRLAQAVPTIQVPATVQAVLAARIDRLPPEDKRLLQTAAVIGTEVPFALLQAIADVPDEVLHRGLAHLQAAEFLYETRLFPEREYTFKHALTHEVAYGGLLQERRRALHAQIVTVLEALPADRLAEQIERLAHHALRGEVWDKALLYCRQAGAKAFARSACREAAAAFEEALVALGHLPESRDTHEQDIDLRLALRTMLSSLGEHEQLFAHLQHAEILAEALEDQRRLGQVSTYMGWYFRGRGDYDQSVASCQRALAIAEALGDDALRVMPQYVLGTTYHDLGDYRRAIDPQRRNLVFLKGELLYAYFGIRTPPSITSRTSLVSCLAELGEFAEGIARSDEGLHIAETVAHPGSFIFAYMGVGQLYLRKGDFHKAVPALERCLALCQESNFLYLFCTAASLLGAAHTGTGRVAEALPLLEQAVQQATTIGVQSGQSRRLASLGEAMLLTGRPEEALSLAQQALELARTHKERGNEAWILRLLGEIAAQREPLEVEHAAAHYRQALALAEELGMRPLQAHCHHGLGTLYAKSGRPEQARLELSTAIALYNAMEMTFWLQPAEAVLAAVG